MSEEKKPAEKVEAAKAEAPKAEAKAEAKKTEAKAEAETPKAEAPKEKKPMDKKKKKKIIIWSCVGGGVLIAAIVAIVLVIVLSKVDYKESYLLATELNDKISDFYYDFDDCEDVVDDVENDWIGISSYSSDITDCKAAVSKDTIDMVEKLAGTSGVTRDDEVKIKFDKFYNEYKKAVGSVNDETASKLDVYDNWHKFVYDSDDYYFYSSTTESDITKIANYAINSGNDTFKTFGEQWKEKALAALKARQAYDKATSNYSALSAEATSKRRELNTWRDENLPKASEVLPLSFEGDTSTIRDAWKSFVSVLGKKYGEKAVEEVINNGSTPSYEDILKELMK